MLLGFIKRPGLPEHKSIHFIQQTYLTPQIRKKSRSSASEPKSAPRDAQEVSKVGCVTLSTQGLNSAVKAAAMRTVTFPNNLQRKRTEDI